MTPDPQAHAFFAHLEPLCVVRASGADAETFLHGQLTNDLKSLAPGQLQLQGYCSPKGRLLALMHATLDGDDILLVMPRDISESLLKRLRMFVLRAAVTLTLDEDVQVLGVSDAAGYPETAPRPLLPLGAGPAALALVPTQQLGEACAALADAYDRGSSEHWAAARLLAGEPQIHPGSADKFVPQMVNLDLLGGLSFNKGCYPGQEIVARTRYLGKVKRRLQLYQCSAQASAEAGSPIYVEGREQAAGELVELLPAGERASVASAVIRLEYSGQNMHLWAPDGPLLQPIPLPYPLDSEAP